MPNAFLAMFVVPETNLPVLHDPPFVLWLCLLATAMGSRLLRVLRLSESELTRLERGVLCAGIGLGLLSNVALLLGLVSLLTPTNVEIALTLLILLFSPDMLRVLRSLRFGNQPMASASGNAPALLFPFSFFLFPSSSCLPPSSNPCAPVRMPTAWRSLARAQTVAAIRQPGLSADAHAYQFPMGVEMLYALALAAWSDTAAKLIHFVLGLLTLFAVYALGRRLYSGRVGLAASLFFALGLPKAPVLTLFTYAYIDLGIALEVLCATIVWFAWQRSGRSGWLLIAHVAGSVLPSN